MFTTTRTPRAVDDSAATVESLHPVDPTLLVQIKYLAVGVYANRRPLRRDNERPSMMEIREARSQACCKIPGGSGMDTERVKSGVCVGNVRGSVELGGGGVMQYNLPNERPDQLHTRNPIPSYPSLLRPTKNVGQG